MQLELDNGTDKSTIVARMRQRNVIHGTKPVLEIDFAAVHLLDLLVITWVFVEQRRRDMDNRDLRPNR